MGVRHTVEGLPSVTAFIRLDAGSMNLHRAQIAVDEYCRARIGGASSTPITEIFPADIPVDVDKELEWDLDDLQPAVMPYLRLSLRPDFDKISKACVDTSIDPSRILVGCLRWLLLS